MMKIERSAVDYGVHIISLDDKVMLVNLSTDDGLLMTNNRKYGQELVNIISEFYAVKLKEGMVIHYLNWRIIQSSSCISIDQS